MEIDLTGVIVTSIALITALAVVIAQLVKRHTNKKEWEELKVFAAMAVRAAETYFKSGCGKEKFDFAEKYIKDLCDAVNTKINTDAVKEAIQKAWEDAGLNHTSQK